ncbi:MAG: transcription-repair coupling factor [Piscirickettsiaceae bacterium]|nr:MAG: transcription-repair coupling factor [Piscirickettsiaceae bacterium]PCI67282.1 MAG: transcription-repair coupling factor [Piscirickettsiaceae bacterium]
MSIPTPELPTPSNKTVSWGQYNGCEDVLNIALAAQQSQQLLVVVCCDTQAAMRLERELPFFLSEQLSVNYFPDWEVLPYDTFSPLPEIISERLQTLYALQFLSQGVLIITVSTLLQRLAPRQQILAECFSLQTGDTLELEKTRLELERLGYQNVSSVQEHSEFSVRGSILDLFPMGSKTPYRIDLLGDEVDSIRTFDTESQRSLDKVNSIELFPAREFPINDSSIQLFRQNFRQQFPDCSHSNNLYQSVSKGNIPNGIEHYMPLFVTQTESFFDYLSDVTLILHGDINTAADAFTQQVIERYIPRKGDIDRPPLAPELLYIAPDELQKRLSKFASISILRQKDIPDPTALIEPKTDSAQQPIHQLLNQPNQRTLFIAESPGHRESMLLQLKKLAIRPTQISSWNGFIESEEATCITVAPIDEGLALEDLSLVTENMLFGNRVQQRRRRRSSTSKQLENVFNSLADLEIGSPVVHQEHGVGRYLGLRHLDIDNIETEFLTLEYANNDKLYVPVSSLNLIGRYMGSQGDSAPLHKLGSEQWQKARKRALQKAHDVAAELLDIHARRAARDGKPMVIESTEYDTFANAFPFEETVDQATAIEQTLHDQSLAKPMDRVICGDVGFGKTEIAMRAAFIATHNHYQVALLVPTTLLAQQHYQTFSDRFADWPIRVEVLSRFVSAKQQKKIISDTADGKVDILIGTHKLLQKSLSYKNLGLVVIDEEQRFGVRHKEYFKSLRSEVDMLTLTATPIPRTLNQAMSGLRDISIIATPPPNRHAIETFVSEWNSSLIQEACEREIRRGGQVFFLHNDISSMDRLLKDIQDIVPDATPRKAHGQMRESELEQIMLDFYHNRFNILVSTTIIENGIDLPNANTIIINRADKLGLSQLHQLRGRVGRSHHRAYSYLIIPPEGIMTKDAKKRITAIENSTDLGAGFSLSTHDMEIRGAGELLGDSQSGEIQEIGFTMYTELLEKAVDALKSGEQPELDMRIDSGPDIDLHCSALIPDDYLPDVHTRLVLYKRIASAEDNAQLRELQIEMIDRFGLLPVASKQLFAISEIKLIAAAIGVDKVDYGKSNGRIQFNNQPNIDPVKILQLIQTQPQVFQLDGPQKLRFTKKLDTIEEKVDFLLSLLNDLRQPDNDTCS